MPRPASTPVAWIKDVLPGSPADDAGFTPGCGLLAVDGHPIRDAIDWRWYTDDYEIELTYVDADGDTGTVVLEREEGETWGFDFTKAIFDDLMLCRNACKFCFMRQLPEDARDTLTLRDDDYRLSFLQGTFVTFTNIGPEDEERIIEQYISPLRFSLHAITPEVRRDVIGKHAPRGIEVAERLLEAGIQVHAQIVLMPGVNDGEELRRTLEWAYAHPGILSVGIVPLGFTKHQTSFEFSFNDRGMAQQVIDCIEPFQLRAMEERSDAWVFCSDEFYRNAHPEDLLDYLPPAEFYGGFDLFEDGIGIVRSFVDDWNACPDAQLACAQAIRESGKRVLFVCGCAQREFFTPLIEKSPLSGLLVPFYVKNEYFGGNVDVTGLLCGCDISAALATVSSEDDDVFAALPKVILNADGVTLDDMTVSDMEGASDLHIHVVSCVASEFLPQIAQMCGNSARR